MSQIAIKVDGLGKLYQLGELERYQTLREALARLARNLFRRSAPLADSAVASTKALWR